jgi:threonylcarbamoyladenosine tRNA methylthiotransferase MtaB
LKYAIITFGCRVNQADSLGFEETLLAGGATASAPETADLVIVNTCSVTASADQGARQTIRRVARSNPGARIVVTGCYATRQPEELAQLPNVASVVANDAKPRLISLTRMDTGIGDGPCGAAIEPGVAGRTAFTLRVQTGCAEPCSYCIIPSTRGAPRSVPIDEVVREAERVVDAGFKEIALTGVHLGSYGRDLDSPSSLIELLRALDGRATCPPKLVADGDILFRISSLEPMDCTGEIVDLVAASPRFAPHFHLPLQHASNRVLAAMRRPYTIERYAALVDGIRAKMPGASIGSDIIVGFPSETDSDFEELAAYLESSPLTHVHVFPYSDRPATRASAMTDKVPGLVVRERARRVREIGQALAARFRGTQVGTVQRALTLDDGSLAVTGNYMKVRIPPGRARNEWVRLRLTSEHHGELLGG